MFENIAKPNETAPRTGWAAVRARISKRSTNNRIMRAALTVGSLTILVKLAAVAKELVVGWRFGVSDALDAYLIAVLIPPIGINIIANSFSTALIPTYIRVREHEGKAAAQDLLASVTGWSLLLLTIGTVLFVAAAPWYLPYLASNFSADKLSLTFRLLCIVAPMMILTGLNNLWGAVLNAGEKFALAALTPVLTTGITIILLLGGPHLGIYALVWGLVVGALVETVALGWALRRQGIGLRPRLGRLDENLRQVVKQFSPKVVGNALRSGTSTADRSFAAMLPAGSVSALNYGNRITSTLLNIIGTALGAAVMPYFSKMAAHGDWAGVRHTLRRYLTLIFAATVPLAAIFYFFSTPIVQMIYQRGSFTGAHAELVGKIQAFYALCLPFSIANGVLSRLLSSVLATHITMWAAALSLVLNVVLDLWLMRHYGIAGLALSTSCVACAIFFFQLYHVIRIMQGMVHDKPEKGKV